MIFIKSKYSLRELLNISMKN